MKKTMPAMMAVLGASFAFGAVQNIEITDANAYAYSAENKLVCDSGSRINVKYSYSLNGREMKTSLIDFIEVTPAAEGAEEPWVSICVEGAGFTNNVDFSEQPYLWLSSRYMNDLVQLSGTYTPYGNEYRFPESVKP